MNNFIIYNENNKHSNDMKAEMYKILLDVENENLTPEQAQTELLGLFSVRHLYFLIF